jgi:hypothetical protein
MRVALLQFTMHALFRRSLATSVPAQLIKNLRERTGAPILECKKALEACALDEQNAIEWLRKSGLNVANKLSARNTATGLVCAIASKDLKAAAIVEVRNPFGNLYLIFSCSLNQRLISWREMKSFKTC